MAAPRTYSTILVTGGAGFIASHVLRRLVIRYPDCHFVNVDKLTYAADLSRLYDVDHLPNYSFEQVDVVDFEAVGRVFEDYSHRGKKIQVVMHFAAETHVDFSFGNSFEFTRTNVLGTHVLLEAAKKYDVELFLHVSTDEVHGSIADGDAEEAVLCPSNPYAASKAGAELLVKSYQTSFGLPAIVTRGNNVYGTRQYPEKIIPKFACQLLAGKNVTIHGDGNHKRNYLFVTDVAAAFDAVLHRGELGKVYNIGGSTEKCNLEVAQDVARALGVRCVAEFGEDRAFNDLRYSVDSSALKALGWCEEVSWEEGLQSTVTWYSENPYEEKILAEVLKAHPERAPVCQSPPLRA